MTDLDQNAQASLSSERLAEIRELRAESERLRGQVADLLSRYDAQKERADKSATRTRGLMRSALRRVNELLTIRDALAGQSARAERIDFTVKEIRDLFKPQPGDRDPQDIEAGEAIKRALSVAEANGADAAIGWLHDYAAGVGGISCGLPEPRLESSQSIPDGSETP